MIKIVKMCSFGAIMGAALAIGPAYAQDRDEKLDSARDAGRAYLREEINPFARPSTDRGEPVIRGDGNIVMPGDSSAYNPNTSVPGQGQEPTIKKTYIYDKSAHGLFADEVLPKRLFNNVQPRR